MVIIGIKKNTTPQGAMPAEKFPHKHDIKETRGCNTMLNEIITGIHHVKMKRVNKLSVKEENKDK